MQQQQYNTGLYGCQGSEAKTGNCTSVAFAVEKRTGTEGPLPHLSAAASTGNLLIPCTSLIARLSPFSGNGGPTFGGRSTCTSNYKLAEP
jgi:hypothetical protein